MIAPEIFTARALAERELSSCTTSEPATKGDGWTDVDSTREEDDQRAL